jgi:hypothetical protein
MSDSLVIDWLNENELRAFPLKEAIVRTADSEYKLTDNVIVDAQFVFESLEETTALTQITVNSDTVDFVIGELTFTSHLGEPYPQYLRHNLGSLLVIGSGAKNIPVGEHNFSNVIFEPSVSCEFGGEWLGVKNISFETSEKLTGIINLIEGYQTDLNIISDTIYIELGKYLGKHIRCDSFGNIENDCSSIVSFINGAAPNSKSEIFLKGDSNIVIIDDPANYRIFIGAIFTSAEDICQDIPLNPAL